MKWTDVCGPPGAGKSTLCDHLWPPHCIKPNGEGLPKEWDDWWQVCISLLDELKDHPTFDLLKGMTYRSLRKMIAVYRRPDDGIYVQTGLAQRGLGFGWRLEGRGKVDLVRPYFQTMPVSLGVALVDCPVKVAIERNRKREFDPRTAHENRAHMVKKMQPAIAILAEVMAQRNVPFARIDVTQPVEDARRDLVRFATERTAQAETARSGGEVALVP